MSWQLQTSSDSAPPSLGQQRYEICPGFCIFLKRKGRGKKNPSALAISKLHEGGKASFACILLRDVSHMLLWLPDVSSGSGWW